MVVFEGVGVGLLVPLLSLLLGGTNAVADAADPVAADRVPEPLAGVLRRRLLRRDRPGDRREERRRLHRAAVRGAAQAARRDQPAGGALRPRCSAPTSTCSISVPAGRFANIFLVETYRTTVAIEAAVVVRAARRASRSSTSRRSSTFRGRSPRWSSRSASAIGGALGFIYRRLGRAGTRLTDLNHRLSSVLEQSFAGVRVVRATNAQAAEIERFREINVAQAASDEETTRAHALLFPLAETLGVIGAMAIVACAYIFFVRPGHMLSSYLLGYGFVLLRLLPLLNSLYSMQGICSIVAGGIREVDRWLSTPVYPERPFGTIEFHRAAHGAAPRGGRLHLRHRHRGAEAGRLRGPRRTDRRHRRQLRLRQIDAGVAPAAAARADRRAHHGRRRRLLAVLGRELASLDRARRAGRVPLSRHAAARTCSTAGSTSRKGRSSARSRPRT